LIPGDPRLGILRYKNNHYSFATIAGMREFTADPERFGLLDLLVEFEVDIHHSLGRCILAIDQLLRRHQELIHLLCMQDVVPNSSINDLVNYVRLQAKESQAGESSLFGELTLAS